MCARTHRCDQRSRPPAQAGAPSGRPGLACARACARSRREYRAPRHRPRCLRHRSGARPGAPAPCSRHGRCRPTERGIADSFDSEVRFGPDGNSRPHVTGALGEADQTALVHVMTLIAKQVSRRIQRQPIPPHFDWCSRTRRLKPAQARTRTAAVQRCSVVSAVSMSRHRAAKSPSSNSVPPSR